MHGGTERPPFVGYAAHSSGAATGNPSAGIGLVNVTFFALGCFLHTASAQNTENNSTTERVGFVWGSSGRDTWGLLQSYVITLLSCTWAVLHLNIPAPNDGSWVLFKRKLKWMIVTLIAPEITCSVALRQWQESRAIVREMAEQGTDWKIAEGFFAAMGGYVLHHRGRSVPLLTPEIISLLKNNSATKQLFQLPRIKKRDIEDRSKASGFTKVFTLAQTGWLVAQCIARGASHLPISQLEITTIAFATCTIVASGFWWNKPLDFRVAIPVTYDGDLPDSFHSDSKGWRDREARQRVKMTTRIITRGSKKSMFFNLTLPLFLFSTIFSVIHLAAWNNDFATPTEQLMWRTCSITATLSPLLVAGFLQIANIWDQSINSDTKDPITAPEFAALVILCYFLSVVTYIAARGILIFQVFYCLRSMPSGIYESVSWVNYIPHV
ncbi:hypothetical protein N431DRAFT_560590 [Stipitochalara longipes BDJ]|nr:hypothetical protein N431DRAFT_560590 [Stipitochalara longipes BDJ]